MPLLILLPLLFILFAFSLLPFIGVARFFSMPVSHQWIKSSPAQKIRHLYQASIAAIAVLSLVALTMSGRHPNLTYTAPIVVVAGVLSAWAWGWSQTLPYRLAHPVTRSAELGPNHATRNAFRCSLAALLPITATTLFLLTRYPTILASSFIPLLLGAVAVVLLALLLSATQQYAAGIADRGKYSGVIAKIVAAATWVLALESSASALLPVMRPALYHSVRAGLFSELFTLILLLAATAVLIQNRALLTSAQTSTDESHWKAGLIYFNRDDAALFVPKRTGLGWTLNFAQPGAWLTLGVTLAVGLGAFIFTRR